MKAERRPLSLRTKFVTGLLMIALAPLAVSSVLIGQIARLAQNFASNEAAMMRPPLEAAQTAYLDLFAAKKEAYRQLTWRVAAAPAVTAAAPSAERLRELLSLHPELVGLVVHDADGTELARVLRGEAPPRSKTMTASLESGRRVALSFAVDESLQGDYRSLVRTLERADHVAKLRATLPSGYRYAFLALVGSVVILVVAVGILYARHFTRRINRLLLGTRAVAAGQLSSRVDLPGRDELAELGVAFNRMVEDLARDRAKIHYLQRIGAWQDVARRLAHEIKNPLTPIQLAVQQCVSAYRGDDERFRGMLDETEEIVTEEIAGLRRLVDAFRTLGQLPRVEPTTLDLGDVVRELVRDPSLAPRPELLAPAESVPIRGDKLLLRRLLGNLVENGIQAAQEQGRAGRVEVQWWREEGRAVLTVDDEGPGIALGEQERIFEPYITSKETGTGLGLAIAKKIAIEHGGALVVASEPAPIGGARLVLTLPLTDDEEATAGA